MPNDSKPTTTYTGDSEAALALIGTPIGLALVLTRSIAGELYVTDTESSTTYSNDPK